jgi:hypothetical protein
LLYANSITKLSSKTWVAVSNQIEYLTILADLAPLIIFVAALKAQNMWQFLRTLHCVGRVKLVQMELIYFKEIFEAKRI